MKNHAVPFNLYDYLGYLMTGFVTIIFIYSLGIAEITKLKNSLESVLQHEYILTVLLMIACYIVGQIVSLFGKCIFVNIIIKKWLNYPSRNFFRMFSDNEKFRNFKPVRWFHFREYKRPYPEEFANKIKEYYEQETGRRFDESEAFLFCFHYVKEYCPATHARLLIFLSLYDFSRNLSVIFLMMGAVYFLSCRMMWGAGCWMFAYLLFFRYLQFFRIFSNEVFRSFYAVRIVGNGIDES
ncbi:MAG: hypothetical protein MJA29_11420 [Candidatus Omnitrophica bacterium]|nr:hypothetical protein [Candidatus Omnitrophota bacterium]